MASGIASRRLACVLRGARRPAALAPRVRCLCSAPTLNTPFISNSVPLAEGIMGRVEELLLEVGSTVEENDVIAVIDTEKVALDVKATRSGVVTAVLVEVGEEVKERQPIYELQPTS